ncbi:MAG: hypothetical protein WCH01_15040 [Methylococcaceae bacterium]
MKINPFDMKAMYADNETEVEDLADVPPTTVTPVVPNKPKRLRPYGDSVLVHLPVDLVIPIAETSDTPNYESVKKTVKAIANFLGCRVFNVEMTIDHIRLKCAIPPTLSVEKLAGRIQHEMLVHWLAVYKKPINFAGGYCADSNEIEPAELAEYLARQKAA